VKEEVLVSGEKEKEMVLALDELDNIFAYIAVWDSR
jgi:hypothetical protein